MYNKNVYKYDEMKRKEHMAVRQSVGWYYWTHQLLEVTGTDAASFLEVLYTNPITNLKVGKERYTTMLNEQGEIIDDVVIFRIEENKFWISTLFLKKLVKWMDVHKREQNIFYEDITSKYDMYAVQGPKSRELVNMLVEKSVDDLNFFSFEENKINNIPVIVNRAGFTGEKLGYEIYISPDQGEALEEKLKEAAAQLGGERVTDFQIMAWTLPTEKGFYYMRDLMHTNPLEVGLDRGIDWEKDFIGKNALLKIKENGIKNQMFGFTMEEADVRIIGKDLGGPGTVIDKAGEIIGRVSKWNYSYVLDQPIGYAYVRAGSVSEGDTVMIAGTEAKICKTVFC